MSRKPIIGIAPSYEYNEERMIMKEGYTNGVIKAGGVAILLPITSSENQIEEYLNLCDGILLSGGPDVNPKYYREQNLKFNGLICPCRDEMEIILAKKAIEMDKSVFGICRGSQVLNVAMGGTLYQDIDSQISGDIIKHRQEAPFWYATHEVYLEKDSILFDIFNKDTIEVNSFHHQCIKDVAPEFKVTSMAKDGVIESIEHINKKFVMGVQWHPEQMWQKYDEFIGLFEKFVDSCKNK